MRTYQSVAIILSAAYLAFTGVEATAAQSTATQPVVRALGNDFFAAGNSVSISKPVAGDLIAFGGSIEASAPVQGDAIVAGGNVRLDGQVAQSGYIAGGQVSINGKVGRNVRVAGGQVSFGPNAEIAGNLSVAGGQINMNGTLKGYLQAGGGSITINGPVAGDVVVTGGNISLGPKARIAGKLRYASRSEIARDPAAQLEGGIERMSVDGGWPVPAKVEHHVGRSGGWFWTIGLMVLVAVLVIAAPNFYTRVSATAKSQPAYSVLFGFIGLVCLPIAAVLLMISIIGIPIALILFVSLPAILMISYASTAIALADWSLQRFAQQRPISAAKRAGAAAAGVLLLAVLSLIPVLGNIFVFAALVCGLGALALQFFPVRHSPSVNASTKPSADPV